MTGIELDRRLREVLKAVTPETSLSASAAIVKLGLPARAAFALVVAACDAKRKQ